MKYLFFIFSIVFFGCKKNDPEPADQLVGTYKVTDYIINGDTLISPHSGNSSYLPDPYINVLKDDEDIIKIEYYSNRSNKFEGGLILTFNLVSSEEKYILIAPKNTIDIYSGYAENNILYLDWASWDNENNKIIRVVTIAKKE